MEFPFLTDIILFILLLLYNTALELAERTLCLRVISPNVVLAWHLFSCGHFFFFRITVAWLTNGHLTTYLYILDVFFKCIPEGTNDLRRTQQHLIVPQILRQSVQRNHQNSQELIH